MRTGSLGVALMVAATVIWSPPAAAVPAECSDPSCVPGITGNVVLGASCPNTEHYVFGTTSWGRLVFCGSPGNHPPRYFRSPMMVGIRLENSECANFEHYVAQSPDGVFLACVVAQGAGKWVRGGH